MPCGRRLTSSLKGLERALEKKKREQRALEGQMIALRGGPPFWTFPGDFELFPDSERHRLSFELQQLRDQIVHLKGLVQLKRAAAGDSAKHEHAGEAAAKTEEEAPEQPAKATNGASTDRSDRRPQNWKEVKISFISDERVQITVGGQTETRNYTELGFEDRRDGKPNKAWLTLRELADLDGTIGAAKTRQEWPKVEKRIQAIRKVLRRRFGISADPVPFRKGSGYRACFRISCSPSYAT